MSGAMRRRAALMALIRVVKRGTPGIGRRLAALPRMIKATIRREYDGGLRLLLMAAAVLYIVSPIDFVPELAFLVFGLIDDAVVITWLTGTLLDETERFLAWEEARKRGPAVTEAKVITS